MNVKNTPIYLDYNASTPCDKRVIDAMNSCWSEYGNPHSSHYFGLQKQSVIDECLDKISMIYNCLPEDILFTSGATEANNLAIFSGIKLAKLNNPSKNIILTSHLEHKSVLEPLKIAAKQWDLTLIFVNLTKEGQIDVIDFEKKISQNQVLWTSVCMTNGEIGTNQPIESLSKICRIHDAVIHVDASQAGYCDIDFDGLDIDYMTISGHKIYGPMGIGLLISRHLQDPAFEPMIYGGGQQNNIRSGTLPLALVVGLTKAIEILDEIKETEKQKLSELRDYLLKKLQDKFNVSIQGGGNRHPANLHLSIQGIDSLQLLNNLQSSVAFSLGSACNGLNRDYPALMKEIGISKSEFEASFRITVGRMTTKAEIDFAIQKIEDLIYDAKNGQKYLGNYYVI